MVQTVPVSSLVSAKLFVKVGYYDDMSLAMVEASVWLGRHGDAGEQAKGCDLCIVLEVTPWLLSCLYLVRLRLDEACRREG
jgi:hypothetical protein